MHGRVLWKWLSSAGGLNLVTTATATTARLSLSEENINGGCVCVSPPVAKEGGGGGKGPWTGC